MNLQLHRLIFFVLYIYIYIFTLSHDSFIYIYINYSFINIYKIYIFYLYCIQYNILNIKSIHCSKRIDDDDDDDDLKNLCVITITSIVLIAPCTHDASFRT